MGQVAHDECLPDAEKPIVTVILFLSPALLYIHNNDMTLYIIMHLLLIFISL